MCLANGTIPIASSDGKRFGASEVLNEPEVVGSKARGACCLANYLSPKEQLLLTLEEYPLGLNFGGSTLFVIRQESGQIETRLDR
jgi:hypothetical protein